MHSYYTKRQAVGSTQEKVLTTWTEVSIWACTHSHNMDKTCLVKNLFIKNKNRWILHICSYQRLTICCHHSVIRIIGTWSTGLKRNRLYVENTSFNTTFFIQESRAGNTWRNCSILLHSYNWMSNELHLWGLGKAYIRSWMQSRWILLTLMLTVSFWSWNIIYRINDLHRDTQEIQF